MFDTVIVFYEIKKSPKITQVKSWMILGIFFIAEPKTEKNKRQKISPPKKNYNRKINKKKYNRKIKIHEFKNYKKIIK